MNSGTMLKKILRSGSRTLGADLSKNVGYFVNKKSSSPLMLGGCVDKTILPEKYKVFNSKYEELKDKDVDVTRLMLFIKEIIALVNMHASELFEQGSNLKLTNDELDALVLLIKCVISQESIQNLKSSITMLKDDPVVLLISLIGNCYISDKLQKLMQHSLFMCVKKGEGNLNKLLCGLNWFYSKSAGSDSIDRYESCIQDVFNQYKTYIIVNRGMIGLNAGIDSANNHINIISNFISEYINCTSQRTDINIKQDVTEVIINLIINTAKNYSKNCEEIKFTSLINLCDVSVAKEILADIGVKLLFNYIKFNNIGLKKLIAILKICCRSDTNMLDILIRNAIERCAEFDLSRTDDEVLGRYINVLCCISYVSSINIKTGQVNFVNDRAIVNNADLELFERIRTQLTSVPYSVAICVRLKQQRYDMDNLLVQINQSQNDIGEDCIKQVYDSIVNCIATLGEYRLHSFDANSELYNVAMNIMLRLIMVVPQKNITTLIPDTLTRLFRLLDHGLVENSLNNSMINLLADYIAGKNTSWEALSNILVWVKNNSPASYETIIKGGFQSYFTQLHRQVSRSDNNYPILMIKCGVLDRVKSIVNLCNDTLSLNYIEILYTLIEVIFVALSRMEINQQNINDYISGIGKLINDLPGIFSNLKHQPLDLIYTAIGYIKYAIYKCENYDSVQLNDFEGLTTNNLQIMDELQRYIIELFQDYVQFGGNDLKKIVCIFNICCKEGDASIILDNIIQAAVNNCAESERLKISSGARLRAEEILSYISWRHSQEQIESKTNTMPKLSNKDSWLEELLLKIGNHEKIFQDSSRYDWLQQQISYMMELNSRSVTQIDAKAYIDDVYKVLQEIKSFFTQNQSNSSNLEPGLINNACVVMVKLIKTTIEECIKFDDVNYSNLLILCAELSITGELFESVKPSIQRYINPGDNEEGVILLLDILAIILIIDKYNNQKLLLPYNVVDKIYTNYDNTIITEVLKYFKSNYKTEVSEAVASRCIAVLSCLHYIDIECMTGKNRVCNVDVLTQLRYRYPELDLELYFQLKTENDKELDMSGSILDILNFVKLKPLLKLRQLPITSARLIKPLNPVLIDDLEK